MPKKSPIQVSKLFSGIIKASVGNKVYKEMKTINIQLLGNTYPFKYSIEKKSDNVKKDRFWTFSVTHDNDALEMLPKSFSFRHDTFNNVTEGKIGGIMEMVCEQIMMKEL